MICSTFKTKKQSTEKITTPTNAEISTSYTYEDFDNSQQTGNRIKSINTPIGVAAYVYDSDGRVSGSELSGTNFSTGTMHQYDSLGRLIRDYASGPWWYYYDDSGNITRKWDMADRDISYEYTDSEWGDLLTKYDGTVISYGVLGNPLNWRNGMSFTWEHEKRLSEIAQNGTQTASYTYDSAGLRSSKTVGGKTVTFEYVNNKLVYQTDGTNVWWFCYDTDGALTALEYNGEIYYYVHDGIGNIIGLVDKNGSVAARYRYDGWGNIEGIIGINGSFDDVSADPTHIANINPFRYKDYYYDSESEFYYLITRYYDPFVGRFLSADSVMAGVGTDVNGYNLFAYCFNNPVNMSDSSGHWPQWIKDAANWVNNNIIQPVANFFNPSTNTISGQFQDGIFRGSGSLTGGYSEINGRLQVNSKDSKNNGMMGGICESLNWKCVWKDWYWK